MPKDQDHQQGPGHHPKTIREPGPLTGDEIESVEDRRGFRVQKRLPDSPFKKYRGYLKDLAGRDPDEVVERIR